jgi:hypothetical protein
MKYYLGSRLCHYQIGIVWFSSDCFGKEPRYTMISSKQPGGDDVVLTWQPTGVKDINNKLVSFSQSRSELFKNLLVV